MHRELQQGQVYSMCEWIVLVFCPDTHVQLQPCILAMQLANARPAYTCLFHCWGIFDYFKFGIYFAVTARYDTQLSWGGTKLYMQTAASTPPSASL